MRVVKGSRDCCPVVLEEMDHSTGEKTGWTDVHTSMSSSQQLFKSSALHRASVSMQNFVIEMVLAAGETRRKGIITCRDSDSLWYFVVK